MNYKCIEVLPIIFRYMGYGKIQSHGGNGSVNKSLHKSAKRRPDNIKTLLQGIKNQWWCNSLIEHILPHAPL